jgi:hypothetical protein
MPNSLTASGQTRLAWSLSDDETVFGASANAEARSSRTISNGTGPNQAQVAVTRRITCTGSGQTFNLTGISTEYFGITGTTAVTNVRELLVQVTTGPTGGFLNLQAPGGITGVRVGVGGQFHWLDYAVGATGTTIALSGGATGTYSVDMTIVGLGG